MRKKNYLIKALFLVTMLPFCSKEITAQPVFKKLVWADEFNYKGLPDSSKWTYDKGNGCPDVCGWGNHELQFYSHNELKNARVENGKLVIEARKNVFPDSSYTSARMVSTNKGNWKYGRLEIRAKIPAGRGIWPAIWMLPTKWAYGGWPKSGEIDIMENVGYWPDSVFGTVHTGAFNGANGKQKSKGISRTDYATAFHVYAIEWTAEKIAFYLDNKKYYEYKNDHSGVDAWPFDQEFHLLLNIAVGGDWGGKYGVDEKIFPQKMLVDYVRVYQ